MGLTSSKIGIILIGMLLPWFAVASEVVVGLYFGKIFAMPGDVKVSKKDGRQEIFHDVAWRDRSFELPFYYTVRLHYWPDADSETGLALDFTHAKLYSSRSSLVSVSRFNSAGTQQSQERLGDSFPRLAFSHGYNYVALNAVYRGSAVDHDSLSDASAYVGAGIGFVVPHVEIRYADMKIDNYKPVGWLWQGMAGVTFGTESDVPLNTEYKLSYGDAKITMPDDTLIELSPTLHHLSAGPIIK